MRKSFIAYLLLIVILLAACGISSEKESNTLKNKTNESQTEEQKGSNKTE